MSTVHIEALEKDIAKIVLMPGDPKRALYIAKNYLKDYKLVNSVRGMTAYTGYYDDKLVTIFPSGMGNPSMGIYSYELFKYYDVSYIIRIGSMGGYDESLKLNDLVLALDSYSLSTYGQILNGSDVKKISSSSFLNERIIEVSNQMGLTLKKGTIYSSDVFYEQNNDYLFKRKNYDVLGVEMETFALYHNAKLLNKKATALLTVSDLFFDKNMLSSKEREKKLDNMIKLALETAKTL